MVARNQFYLQVIHSQNDIDSQVRSLHIMSWCHGTALIYMNLLLNSAMDLFQRDKVKTKQNWKRYDNANNSKNCSFNNSKPIYNKNVTGKISSIIYWIISRHIHLLLYVSCRMSWAVSCRQRRRSRSAKDNSLRTSWHKSYIPDTRYPLP